ncbi:MAG: D-aminoacyl-tRNA deacylase [Tenericutes bacterium]|nr:D-aminoacyl-tRNA deacylase [Mycoplasmatota bacterium]MDY3801298.1 D-aminoacyl-tRNA deacylase [Bacilli bacterium]
MRVLVQKSLEASVKVDGKILGSIDSGLVLLVGFTEGDNEEIIDKMISKTINLRIFEDENGVMNKSFLEVGGSILSISQFTLYADTRKGRRPSYLKALNGEKSVLLYDLFNKKLKDMNIDVQTGKFGADMKVSLVNDGPTTIMLDSEDYK